MFSSEQSYPRLVVLDYRDSKDSVLQTCWIKSIYHGYMVWIEKSVTRVTDRHHEACRVMPNSDPE